MRPQKRIDGFSLLEITIALVLLTVGLVGVLHLFPAGLRAGKRASFVNEATLVARERLEEVKRVGVVAIEKWQDELAQAELEGVEPPMGPLVLEGEEGRITWQIVGPEIIDRSDEGLGFPNEIRRVAVMVSWQDQGETRRREIATYVNR